MNTYLGTPCRIDSKALFKLVQTKLILFDRSTHRPILKVVYGPVWRLFILL